MTEYVDNMKTCVEYMREYEEICGKSYPLLIVSPICYIFFTISNLLDIFHIFLHISTCYILGKYSKFSQVPIFLGDGGVESSDFREWGRNISTFFP